MGCGVTLTPLLAKFPAEWSDWGEWGECIPSSCAVGYRQRRRQCLLGGNGSTTAAAVDSGEVDSVEVDSVEVDSVEADSVEVDGEECGSGGDTSIDLGTEYCLPGTGEMEHCPAAGNIKCKRGPCLKKQKIYHFFVRPPLLPLHPWQQLRGDVQVLCVSGQQRHGTYQIHLRQQLP